MDGNGEADRFIGVFPARLDRRYCTGAKAVGHTVTAGDREAATTERARLQVGHDGPASQRLGEAVARVQSDFTDRVSGDRKASELAAAQAEVELLLEALAAN